ncbi:MAG: hypothetical protein JWL77_5957 [Chthonomonadaceae bacterium]|nr:hypothetical protein [Chthonomonadaceae bacterium]
MKKRFRLSESSGKTLIALTLVALLALPIFCLFPHHLAFAAAQPHARRQGKDFKQQAAVICTALGDAKPTIGEPQFVVQDFRVQALPGERRLWTVECAAGAHRYTIIFNDRTGNLECMFAEGLAVSSCSAVRDVAVTSPGQAVEGSVRRLKDLQLVPKGTLITLVGRPQRDRDGITWRLIWKVRPPKGAIPYEVRMVLNGADATPLMVANCSEMARSL